MALHKRTKTGRRSTTMLLLSLLVVATLIGSATAALASKPASFDGNGRAVGIVGDTGFNEWGYNYQAHLFSGGYCDSYRDAEWCQEYADIKLIMKWNEAWLSNVDSDGDGNLDRHLGFDTYRGSGAWLTNHQAGEYIGDDGQTCKWTYFVKIVAAPDDAIAVDGYWQTAAGIEIGQVIWGQFAVIQRIDKDKCAGVNGAQYVSPFASGFGAYSPN